MARRPRRPQKPASRPPPSPDVAPLRTQAQDAQAIGDAVTARRLWQQLQAIPESAADAGRALQALRPDPVAIVWGLVTTAIYLLAWALAR